MSKDNCQDIVTAIAQDNLYDPIQDYLERAYKEIGGDLQFLDDLATRYLGTEAPIYNTFLKYTLIAAVARIYEPGCKVDNALILQGGQGIGKSTFFKSLASPNWFDDSLGAISDKDERLKLHRAWFVEWGELESVFKRKDISAVKSFLTCSTDLIRKPYASALESLPRRSVIVGSTNQPQFLVDATGNRRFWVIPVQKRIDLARLGRERDLIWASAVSLYKSGHTWILKPEEETFASELIEEFVTEDPWTDKVRAFLHGKTSATASEVLDALGLENFQQTKAAQMRVAELLKKLRWKSSKRLQEGRQLRVWMPQELIDPIN
jgi:predicted P-loop ATPase